MKYSFMSFSFPKLNLDELLAAARRLHYDGLEPRCASQHGHGIELEAGAQQRKEMREKSAQSGIEFCCLATSCKYCDPSTFQAQIDDTLRYIDLAADIGAARLRVFGGTLATGVNREQGIDLVAKAMRAVAAHAQDRGVAVCVESHDDWIDPQFLRALMLRVDHPSIAINWDFMHTQRHGSSPEEAFRALGLWVKHVHFHDGLNNPGKLELTPLGKGVCRPEKVISLLARSHYDGYLSGEWFGLDNDEVFIAGELAAAKEFERL
ncbi:MAG: sugar phosphate isomerase/epimerase [Verrucomicrobia bacterium]|nr:sugar phosphate isomerase/epimerase [Verrucomicrobiota bacterium]